ncbi:MAG: hypothetical protein KJ787_02750 [Gammaproteobacteria bacterium]|nr:hypothetical protein [Gammaproteobacteria bacterium]MBU1645234.1 hypothetical protein [Gammaproteobacteria bacterium]MBU1971571.1 hypothetical protein [Gammaproteobacteria bacterium]
MAIPSTPKRNTKETSPPAHELAADFHVPESAIYWEGVRPIDSRLVERMRALTDGIPVDLESALDPADEYGMALSWKSRRWRHGDNRLRIFVACPLLAPGNKYPDMERDCHIWISSTMDIYVRG